ncbi:MAG: hypothetical protein H5U00_10050 [Clostridia bacterium]|nr:hypothetical protein [Clostridia bacterium]
MSGVDLEDTQARDAAIDKAASFAETLPPMACAEAVEALAKASGVPSEALEDEL